MNSFSITEIFQILGNKNSGHNTRWNWIIEIQLPQTRNKKKQKVWKHIIMFKYNAPKDCVRIKCLTSKFPSVWVTNHRDHKQIPDEKQYKNTTKQQNKIQKLHNLLSSGWCHKSPRPQPIPRQSLWKQTTSLTSYKDRFNLKMHKYANTQKIQEY